MIDWRMSDLGRKQPFAPGRRPDVLRASPVRRSGHPLPPFSMPAPADAVRSLRARGAAAEPGCRKSASVIAMLQDDLIWAAETVERMAAIVSCPKDREALLGQAAGLRALAAIEEGRSWTTTTPVVPISPKPPRR